MASEKQYRNTLYSWVITDHNNFVGTMHKWIHLTYEVYWSIQRLHVVKPKIHSTNVEFQIRFQIFRLTWTYWSWATFEPISEDYQADQHKTLDETCMSRSALTVYCEGGCVIYCVSLSSLSAVNLWLFVVKDMQSNKHRLSTELIFSPSVSLYKQSSSSISLLLANQSDLFRFLHCIWLYALLVKVRIN